MENRVLGGYLEFGGNAAMFANGLIAHLYGDAQQKAAGRSRMYSGVMSNGSALLLAKYGDQPVNRQFDRLQSKLAAYLKKEGVPLDIDTLKKATDEQRRSWFNTMEDFCYNHVSELNAAYIALVDLGMMHSGIIRLKKGETLAGIGNISMSVLTIGAALTSILVPEETKEQVAAKGQSNTLWGKLKQKPLSLATGMFVLSDLTEGINAIGEHRTAMKAGGKFGPWSMGMAAFSALTMGLFTTADTLAGSGSKLNGGDPEERKKAQQELVEKAAAILASQPKKVRKALIHKTAEYMVKQPELRMANCDVNCDVNCLEKDMLAAIETHANTGKKKSISHSAKTKKPEDASHNPVKEIHNQAEYAPFVPKGVSDKKCLALLEQRGGAIETTNDLMRTLPDLFPSGPNGTHYCIRDTIIERMKSLGNAIKAESHVTEKLVAHLNSHSQSVPNENDRKHLDADIEWAQKSLDGIEALVIAATKELKKWNDKALVYKEKNKQDIFEAAPSLSKLLTSRQNPAALTIRRGDLH
jgi:hypothetical protein